MVILRPLAGCTASCHLCSRSRTRGRNVGESNNVMYCLLPPEQVEVTGPPNESTFYGTCQVAKASPCYSIIEATLVQVVCTLQVGMHCDLSLAQG
jgi:hypothetical protein